jgi:hypothetical protein
MSSVIDISFTRPEKRTLLQQRTRAASLPVWNCAKALLLMAAKVAMSEFRRSLNITRKTLLNWKRRWLKRRHFGLEDAEGIRKFRQPKPAYFTLARSTNWSESELIQ